MSFPVLLGVADSTTKDFSEEEYKSWNGSTKVFNHYKKSISTLLDFIGMKNETLASEITDFVSIEAASLGKQGYGHTVRIANELGYTGMKAHVIDLGGASVTGAIGQARTILVDNPDAVVLVAAADVPKSAFRQVSDLKMVNETVCHPEYELDNGATLIAMYGLLMKRMMFEEGISLQDLTEITKKFRSNAITNPRSVYYNQEITEKQMSRPISDPYPTPMIAIVTDHGFATLLISEEKANSWKAKGLIRKDLNPIYLAGASHAAHSEYFILKGGFASPSKNAAEKLFAQSGFQREEVDYAWIYDCFTGMVIQQSSQYFKLDKKDVVNSLKSSTLKLSNGKQIPINQMGGILNYQAAMSISAATGLVDLAVQYGIYAQADQVGKVQAYSPKVSLLGGNGGIDSINSVALFTTEAPTNRKSRPPELSPLTLNRPGADVGEVGTIWSSTTVNMNPGFSWKPPYSLALVKLGENRFVIANVHEKDGTIRKTGDELQYDRTQVKIEKEGRRWKAILL
ncbi:thiolase C-terminal domain-containing protein [Leptospira sarikeiensis]|uniref:Thiolase family protein n=1 Tax=Leptospira sarikeiensis TaxID=2484943 RepID=A0A4R9K467_9LEPT|nr:OB-fold domain-containing protein [Leptospira sarikeiensis]TGL60899.1 thiolase family protein [Leptospira sarikeiensis]